MRALEKWLTSFQGELVATSATLVVTLWDNEEKMSQPACDIPATFDLRPENVANCRNGLATNKNNENNTLNDMSQMSQMSQGVEFKERAAIAEFDGDIPKEWAEGFARLQMIPRPASVSQVRWNQLINDAGLFLDAWAAKVSALGWTTAEVFGCHPAAPNARYECQGLIWLIHGNDVIAISDETVTLRTITGTTQRIFRTEGPGIIPVWELS